jgi:hypothetical protein
MNLHTTIDMQDPSLDRFGQLLENLKAQKKGEQEESDERAAAFNQDSSGGNVQNMMNSMM